MDLFKTRLFPTPAFKWKPIQLLLMHPHIAQIDSRGFQNEVYYSEAIYAFILQNYFSPLPQHSSSPGW